MHRVKLVVLDLDNTLYDWVGFYIPSFLAMVHEVSRISGIRDSDLKSSFKRVHETHKSSEYAFAIEELDILKPKYGNLTTREVLQKFSVAIEAFRETRQRTMHLYDGVLETLTALKSEGRMLVALTDTTMYYATRRLKDLGIELFFDMICAPVDHGLPQGVLPEEARRFSDSWRYQSRIPIQLNLDGAIRKPDPRILHSLLNSTNTSPRETVLVGDSLTKDILLAKRCDVTDVYAEYGARVNPSLFGELLKITYWTDQDVAEDRRLRQQNIKPTFTIQSFRELLEVIRHVEGSSEAASTK